MSSTLNVWIDAARPKTLWAAVAPIAMASAMAWRDGGFDAPTAVICLVTAMLLQVGTNFCKIMRILPRAPTPLSAPARCGPPRRDWSSRRR